MSAHAHNNDESTHKPGYKYFAALAALGVVYGDIGTSPLYAFKESFHYSHLAVNDVNVYGILSLIFWSLVLVVSVKYLMFVLKADNKGEGGILALTALITPKDHPDKFKKGFILLGLFGTALLYGDGMITPAISVLSAVEGLELITPVLKPYILPITVGILIGLFSVQRYGTSAVGKVFGPITLTWFLTLGALGVYNIVDNPHVFSAINPWYAYHFFIENAFKGFMVLGSVFLVITGGEALYSDLGHFGRKPITMAWFYVVLPCLILNYFGQGAVLLANPAAVKNPFFLMAPNWALTPLVVLATLATCIASQALITGVFSITMQAVQLGYLSRVMIKHTSEKEIGQIYVRSMNRFLMISCIALVLAFKSSSNLAAAYGIAVTTTMFITTMLFYFVTTELWHWAKWKSLLLCGFFLVIDFAFMGANFFKIFDGGWVPLLVGIAIFTYMTTWKTGRKILAGQMAKKTIPLNDFLDNVDKESPFRAKGCAVYMASALKNTPYALIHTYEHFRVVHEMLVFLSVMTEPVPQVEESRRIDIVENRPNCFSVFVHYGYMEIPDITKVLNNIQLGDFKLNAHEATYFIGKEHLIASEKPGMALWREKLFAMQTINAQDATTYFQIPKNRVMEIGVQVEI